MLPKKKKSTKDMINGFMESKGSLERKSDIPVEDTMSLCFLVQGFQLGKMTKKHTHV
jgi:hypothetical protein